MVREEMKGMSQSQNYLLAERRDGLERMKVMSQSEAQLTISQDDAKRAWIVQLQKGSEVGRKKHQAGQKKTLIDKSL